MHADQPAHLGSLISIFDIRFLHSTIPIDVEGKNSSTVKLLKIWTPKKTTVIILKFDWYGVMHPNDADGMANSVDPDQTAAPQSDLGLHCLLRPVRKFRNITVSSLCSLAGPFESYGLTWSEHLKTGFHAMWLIIWWI